MAEGTKVGSAYYQLDLDDSKLKSGISDSGNALEGFKSTLLKIGAAIGAAFVIDKVKDFAEASVKAFEESQNLIAQTDAVLKSTKGAAGVTADAVDKLSKSLQSTTTYSDESVRSAENMLLTFTNIGKNVFPQATQAVTDMATAMGSDLQATAIQVGKALQDPVLGATALQRVGVRLTETQKDLIKHFVATGQAGKAQAVILKELNTEFGGSAAAQAQTYAGKMQQLKNNFNDIQESIGKVIVSGLTPITKAAAEFLTKIDWEGVIKKTVSSLEDFWQHHLVPIGQAIRDVAEQVGSYLQPKLEALWNTIEQKLMPTLKRWWQEILLPLIEALGPIVGAGLVWAIGLGIDIINILAGVVQKVTTFLLDHKTMVVAVAAAFGVLVTAMALGAAFDALTVGFATFTLITIPDVMASLSALGAAFVAAIPVVAVAVAVAAVVASIYTIKDAWDAVNNAQRAANNLDNAETESQIKNFQKQAAAARAVGDTKKAGQIANAIAALTGGRAAGGPVTGRVPYMVGEKGPELFVPNVSGQIVPNHKLANMSRSNTTNIYGDINLKNQGDIDYFFTKLGRNVELSAQGLTPLR